MADRRKLQGEIDRCLKKVDEGVETFEDIWKKVLSATNTNQKEKFESDLKKEIKKLQRLRDQIKTWLANSDIKDKSSLLEKRKLIETQMERFKVVERETKTKAYSKDGLGAAAKVDPQTKEKSEVTHWLSNVIDALQMQLDQFESEMEARSGSSKKKNKDSKYEELKQQQDRHKYHIETLEKVMRHVDNDKLPLDRVKDLREDLEYFVESNQDPSFQENQYLYDELDLEGLGIGDTGVLASSPPDHDDFMVDKVISTPSSTNSSSPSPSPSANSSHSNDKHDDVERKRHKSQSEEKKGASPAPVGSSSKSTTLSKHSQNNHHPVTPSPLTAYAAAAGGQSSTVSGNRYPQPTPSVWQRSLSTQSNSSSDSQKSHANSIDHGATGALTSNTSLLGSTNTNSVSLTSSGNPSISSAPSPQTSSGTVPTASTVHSSLSSVINNSTQGINSRPEGPPTMNGPISSGPSLQKGDDFSLRTMAQQAVANAELEKSMPSSHTMDSSSIYVSQASSQPTVPSSSTSSLPVSASSDHQSSISLSNPSLSTTQLSSQHPAAPQAPQTNSIHLNPLLGMAPLGPTTITKDQMYQLAMLDAAYHHLPHPSDSERMRNFLPRNPCPTPSYYPSAALPHADSVEFYQRCGTETLFFIFYYMEGTKAQYLAAKALKKQSWRFHTKYMMWFQRHDEPKQITEDFEQGTYIYFDYEKWGQKRKEAFIFEYRYLEDRDLN